MEKTSTITYNTMIYFRETLLGQLTVHQKQLQEQFSAATGGKVPKGKNLPEFVNVIVYIRQLEAKVSIPLKLQWGLNNLDHDCESPF